MKTSMISDSVQPSHREVGAFLARYASWLMGCGATCVRIEKNVSRIARTYGKRVEITVMPRHIQLSVFDMGCDECRCLTLNTSVRNIPVSFSLNTRLSRLSWQIADSGLSLEQATDLFNSAVAGSPQNPWVVLLLVTFANMAFCRLFGGDPVACAVVGLATMPGYWLKTVLLRIRIDIRVTFIICAFVSAVLGCTDILFHIGNTPAVALGTSILYLVPGIPLLNSFSDMLCRHYICAFGRFADAVVLTCSLSIGLCLAMLVMHVSMF